MQDPLGREQSEKRRHLFPEFRQGNQWYLPGDELLCCVCRIELFSTEVSTNPDTTGWRTKGGLLLCKRHYDQVEGLTGKGIPVDKWPSHIVRGIITHYRLALESTKGVVGYMQSQMSGIQTVKTVPFIMPTFGTSFSPLYSGSWTDFFFLTPTFRQVVDQQALAELSQDQNYIQQCNLSIDLYNKEIGRYSQLLEELYAKYKPAFMSCARCGQSEMALGTKQCVFCGQSQGYATGDVAPRKCLIEEVDPVGVIHAYVDDIGSVIDVNRKVTPENFWIYCRKCGNIFESLGNAVNNTFTLFECPRCSCKEYDVDIASSRAIKADALETARMRSRDLESMGLETFLRTDIERRLSTELDRKLESIVDNLLKKESMKPSPDIELAYSMQRRESQELERIVEKEGFMDYLKRTGKCDVKGYSTAIDAFVEDYIAQGKISYPPNTVEGYPEGWSLREECIIFGSMNKGSPNLSPMIEEVIFDSFMEANESIRHKYLEGTSKEREDWADKLKNRGLAVKMYKEGDDIEDAFLLRHPEYALQSPQRDTIKNLDQQGEEIVSLMEEREKTNMEWIALMNLEIEKTGKEIDVSKWESFRLKTVPTESHYPKHVPTIAFPSEGKATSTQLGVNFCPECGTKLKSGSRFCHNCGFKIPSTEE
ncbi:MAG: zinc ribbon domain-containing protein [Candidatus Thermoplasmatota archaeon]|jgi:hypothetical protein|nr:zinc ribbon domain-containing protein [Candidatus Thermoplasmatota archaeon]